MLEIRRFSLLILSILADDILVMADKDHPTYMWDATVSEVDGRYLQLCIRKDTSRVCILF